jgi:dUTP pyrophosphatase
MKVKIKRFDKSLPLPEYKTDGAACVDLYSRLDVKILPHSFGKIPVNIAVEIPKGCFVLMAARSSTHKLGLIPANGIAIGDEDYCGDNDEYSFLVYNVTDSEVLVERGSRVAQLMVLNIERIEFQEVDVLGNKDRGGIGSTGLK